MLPTSYRGAATIDGEAMAAELHLDAENITLRLENEQQVLRWPISQTDVSAIRNGDYRLRMGEETFEFTPVVDDGLGDEIALRRRFAQNGAATSLDDAGGSLPAPAPSIADRVVEAGRTSARRPGVLEGKDLGLRTALVVLGVLALAVVSVAVWSGALQNRPETVVVGADASAPTTQAAPEATVAPPTTVPATTVPPAAPATTLPPATTTTLTPPTVAPATVTTATTVPPPTSVFEMTPEQFAAEWDRVARPLDPALGAGQLEASDTGFSFDAGDYVEVQGGLTDGRVRRIRILGDPSGPDFEDRRVLSALGITVAVVEPGLPASGRRDLLESLGLDVSNPVVEGDR
ncbi:MAG TPA: hypothetical protein VLB85_06030, partial [Acidimicrobiia bacterium]|nr:hypothetical protein [Acidimicrobiia bacterium]